MVHCPHRSGSAVWSAVCLLLLTAWGFALRFQMVGVGSLWIDEAVSVSQAQAILTGGIPEEPNGTADWNSFPTTYLAALGLRLFNDLQFGSRFFSVIAGTACIPLTFLLARWLFRTPFTGWLAAICTAFMYDQIAWSRQARPYIFLEFFFILTCCAILLYGSTRKIRHAAVGVLSALLCMACHRAGYLAVLTCLLSAAWIGLSEVRATRTLRTIGAASIGVLLLLGVFVLASWMSPANQTNLCETLRSLRNPYGTRYGMNYLWVLNEQFGYLWIFVAAIGCMGIATCRKELAIPLILSGTIYFAVLSDFTWMYADRYLFILSSIVILFLSQGVFVSANLLRRLAPQSVSDRSFVVWLSLAAAAYLCTTRLVLVPREDLSLGVTAPQPDWQTAFALIRKHNRSVGRANNDIVTISSYPLLHDVYLGRHTGKKYYLLTSFGGHPDGVAKTPPHSTAKIVKSLDRLLSLSGYLFADEFSLRMMENRDIRNYLRQHKPNAILKSDYLIFIWELRGNTNR